MAQNLELSTITENHVNAFKEIGEIICVIYEFLERKSRNYIKTNLGICTD